MFLSPWPPACECEEGPYSPPICVWGSQQPPSTADPLPFPSRPSPGAPTPSREGPRRSRSKLQHTLVLELVSWGGLGGSAGPGAEG